MPRRRGDRLSPRQEATLAAFEPAPYAIVDILYTVRGTGGAAIRGLLLRGLLEYGQVSQWLDMSTPNPDATFAGIIRPAPPRPVYRLTDRGRALLRRRRERMATDSH